MAGLLVLNRWMRFPTRLPTRLKVHLRRGDGVRLAVAVLAMIGMLSFLLSGILYFRPAAKDMSAGQRTPAEASADAEAVLAAEMRRQAMEQQIGSIVFVTRQGLCEEIRFNNLSEQIVSIEHVDCEDRLTRATGKEALEAQQKAARMREVLAGFKR